MHAGEKAACVLASALDGCVGSRSGGRRDKAANRGPRAKKTRWPKKVLDFVPLSLLLLLQTANQQQAVSNHSVRSSECATGQRAGGEHAAATRIESASDSLVAARLLSVTQDRSLLHPLPLTRSLADVQLQPQQPYLHRCFCSCSSPPQLLASSRHESAVGVVQEGYHWVRALATSTCKLSAARLESASAAFTHSHVRRLSALSSARSAVCASRAMLAW